MPAWLIWLIVACVFAAVETLSLDLVLLMLAGGAGAAAIAAAAGAPPAVQMAVGAAVSLALLTTVRPVAKRHLLGRGAITTGTEALVGMEARVSVEVDATSGRVRLNGGDWSARAYDPTQHIAVGATVRVMEISGATAVVWEDNT